MESSNLGSCWLKRAKAKVALIALAIAAAFLIFNVVVRVSMTYLQLFQTFGLLIGIIALIAVAISAAIFLFALLNR